MVLIVSGTSRRANRQRLKRDFTRAVVPVRVAIDQSRLVVEREPWHAYWKPCQRFFEADRRLVHRVNQLKKTRLELEPP
ncbi:MAG: hypothetical protein KKI02_11820 [Planctomycetes bacterium]|nr:hypothetical protein [Planctomycetota bacterium]